MTPVDGVFSESLDFGVNAWTANQAMWLELDVDGDQLGRQKMEGAPYALNSRGITVDDLGRVGVGGSGTFWPLTVNSAGDGFVQANFPDGVTVGSYAGGGMGWYGTYSDHPLGFFVNYAADPSMMIATNGNVGIGTSSPTDRLHVAGGDLRVDTFSRIEFGLWTGNHGTSENGDGVYLYRFNGAFDNSNLYLNLGNEGNDAFIIQANGVDKFHFFTDGNAYKPGGGSWAALSDVRAKRDVASMKHAMDRLLQLHGVTFHYKDPAIAGAAPGLRMGMIAQEVEQVFPEWVSTNRDGMKVLSYSGFEALAVEALRELRDEKEAEIKSLRDENAALAARLAAIEAAIARTTGAH